MGEGFEEGPSEGLRQELVPARLLRGPRELEGYLRREVGALSAELLRAGSTAAVQRKRPDGRGRGRVRARPAPAPE